MSINTEETNFKLILCGVVCFESISGLNNDYLNIKLIKWYVFKPFLDISSQLSAVMYPVKKINI